MESPLPSLDALCQILLNPVFPPRCLVCGDFKTWQFSQGKVEPENAFDPNATSVCRSCQKGFTCVKSPLCVKCGLPFVSREGSDHTCSTCLTQKRYFRKARAYGVYDGNLMEAIHLLKYEKKTALAKPLSALARKAFYQSWDAESIDLLVPVPLHVRRLRERGFNQAYLLARRWTRQEGIPLDGLNLCRHRCTEPQTTLSRADRQKNIRGAFALRYPERIQGQKIVLVDDVYTTGATVNECAKVLMDGGAEFVDVLTLARAE
jgi:ComF family protein